MADAAPIITYKKNGETPENIFNIYALKMYRGTVIKQDVKMIRNPAMNRSVENTGLVFCNFGITSADRLNSNSAVSSFLNSEKRI
jgi:hypothetical protein